MVEKDILIYSRLRVFSHALFHWLQYVGKHISRLYTKKLIKDAQDFKPLCLYSQIHRSFKRSTQKKRERECVKYI